MKFITTNFTPQNISIPMGVEDTEISIKRITVKEFKEDVLKAKGDIKSAIRYSNVANIVSGITGVTVEQSTEPFRAEEGDVVYQVRVIGPRLDDNADKLGKDNKLQVYKITYRRAIQKTYQPK